MYEKLLIILVLVFLCACTPATDDRPNIVLVMMDDFGFGAFAPNAVDLSVEDYDPAFVAYLRKHKVAYDDEQPLEFARRAMPTIMKLADSGVVFTNAHAASNLCAPSRAGVLTATRPSRFGVYINIDLEEVGFPEGSVIAERLQTAGYATGMIGKWHAGARDESLRQAVLQRHGYGPGEYAKAVREHPEIAGEVLNTGYTGSVIAEHHPLNNGFDYYFGYNHFASPFYNSHWIWENFDHAGVQERYNTELFTDKALEFMKRARSEGEPFFVEVAYHAVHDDLTPKAPDQYFDKFPSESYNLTNFFAHVNAVDEGVRAILEDLDANDELENTLFLFCSDNGAQLLLESPLPGNAPYSAHKGNYREGGHRIPMLLHWPARVNGGQRRDELVSMLDLMPTALEAAGVELPTGLDGRSLIPLVTGESNLVHQHLLWVGIHARAWGFWGETTIGEGSPHRRRNESPGAWKVSDGRYVLRFVGTTPAGLYTDAPEGIPAHYGLYDVQADPLEATNLYEQEPDIARRLEEVFAAYAGQLPAPSRWPRDRWEEITAKWRGR